VNQLIIQTDMPFKTLESKETKAQEMTRITHNSVFAAHRLNAGFRFQDRHPAFSYPAISLKFNPSR
jgi:hypothetical protein